MSASVPLEQVFTCAWGPVAGAIELRSEILANLSRRFMARTIKLVFGPQV